MTNLRSIKVTYSNGHIIETSMAAHLTDQDIKDYFKIGKVFNIGNVSDDLQRVTNVEITPRVKPGMLIEITHGYNNDIRSTFKVTEIKEDDIYLDWDCHWFPIKDDKRRNIKIIN